MSCFSYPAVFSFQDKQSPSLASVAGRHNIFSRPFVGSQFRSVRRRRFAQKSFQFIGLSARIYCVANPAPLDFGDVDFWSLSQQVQRVLLNERLSRLEAERSRIEAERSRIEEERSRIEEKYVEAQGELAKFKARSLLEDVFDYYYPGGFNGFIKSKKFQREKAALSYRVQFFQYVLTETALHRTLLPRLRQCDSEYLIDAVAVATELDRLFTYCSACVIHARPDGNKLVIALEDPEAVKGLRRRDICLIRALGDFQGFDSTVVVGDECEKTRKDHGEDKSDCTFLADIKPGWHAFS